MDDGTKTIEHERLEASDGEWALELESPQLTHVKVCANGEVWLYFDVTNQP
jgi:hypothetical protein